MAAFFTVTVAPGTTAPAESVTLPEIVPLIVWLSAEMLNKQIENKATTNKVALFLVSNPPESSNKIYKLGNFELSNAIFVSNSLGKYSYLRGSE